MSLVNASPYRALAVPSVTPDGHEVVIAIVKATFVGTEEGTMVLASEASPVRTQDVMQFPEEAESSIRYPSDVCTGKRGVDVVVVGDAVSPKAVTVMGVAVAVGALRVTLRVHGERLYYRGLRGMGIGPAAPFERKPVVYERAYGGATADGSVVEQRNPLGRGVAKEVRDLEGTVAPQIEHPGSPIVEVGTRYEPVGFGAIGPAWSPRREYAGTFDAAWLEERMPLMPRDFDVRYNNVAHPSLQLDAPLASATPILVTGMTPGGLWRATTPVVPLVVQGRFEDGTAVTERPGCDTLLITPEEERLEMTFRAVFRVGRSQRRLREIRVDVDA